MSLNLVNQQKVQKVPPAAPVQAVIPKVRYFEDPVFRVSVYRFRVGG